MFKINCPRWTFVIVTIATVTILMFIRQLYTIESNFQVYSPSAVQFDKVDSTSNQYAVCILMATPDTTLFHWLEHLKGQNISIFIMSDEERGITEFEHKNGFMILRIKATDSVRNGYQMLSNIQNRPPKGIYAVYNMIKNSSPPRLANSWDKALYFFNRLSPKQYKFIWFIENDVYIPSRISFLKVHQEAQARDADLVIARNDVEVSPFTQREWLWTKIARTFKMPPPWYGSVACATGLSQRMMAKIDHYAQKHMHLEYLEVFFNTLAMHSNFSVWNPPELHSIFVRKAWTCTDVKSQPMNWYHPIKNVREFIGECVLIEQDWLRSNSSLY